MIPGLINKPAINQERGFTNSLGIEFVYVPAGEFQMGSENGSSDEKPVRRVTFANGSTWEGMK